MATLHPKNISRVTPTPSPPVRQLHYLQIHLFLEEVDLFNPLHPNISMHILHTVLHTFPKRLTRRICVAIKSCVSDHLYSHNFMFDSGVILREEIRCLSLLGAKGFGITSCFVFNIEPLHNMLSYYYI